VPPVNGRVFFWSCAALGMAAACGPAAFEPFVPEATDAADADAGDVLSPPGLPRQKSDASAADGPDDSPRPTPPRVVSLTAGGGHVCALLDRGALACWGANFKGESAATQPAQIRRPVLVAALTRPAVALAAGGRHTCAILDDQNVTCWGANDFQQRGDVDAKARPAPGPTVMVGAKVIAAGDANTCALGTLGVTCWGANDFAQLAPSEGPETNPSVETSLPVVVDGLQPSGLVDLGVGTRFFCARTQGGAVFCRGRNQQGQLGRGGQSLFEPSLARAIEAAPGAVRLAVGSRHVCAVTADGQITCFGANDAGQLGEAANDAGEPASRPGEPRRVAMPAGLGGVESLAAGYEHTCAVVNGGAVICWGGNVFMQCGQDPALAGRSVPPTVVAGVADAVSIVASDHSTCALRKDGRVLCWGSNTNGTLGDGTLVGRHAPREVSWP